MKFIAGGCLGNVWRCSLKIEVEFVDRSKVCYFPFIDSQLQPYRKHIPARQARLYVKRHRFVTRLALGCATWALNLRLDFFVHMLLSRLSL